MYIFWEHVKYVVSNLKFEQTNALIVSFKIPFVMMHANENSYFIKT